MNTSKTVRFTDVAAPSFTVFAKHPVEVRDCGGQMLSTQVHESLNPVDLFPMAPLALRHCWWSVAGKCHRRAFSIPLESPAPSRQSSGLFEKIPSIKVPPHGERCASGGLKRPEWIPAPYWNLTHRKIEPRSRSFGGNLPRRSPGPGGTRPPCGWRAGKVGSRSAGSSYRRGGFHAVPPVRPALLPRPFHGRPACGTDHLRFVPLRILQAFLRALCAVVLFETICGWCCSRPSAPGPERAPTDSASKLAHSKRFAKSKPPFGVAGSFRLWPLVAGCRSGTEHSTAPMPTWPLPAATSTYPSSVPRHR